MGFSSVSTYTINSICDIMNLFDSLFNTVIFCEWWNTQIICMHWIELLCWINIPVVLETTRNLVCMKVMDKHASSLGKFITCMYCCRSSMRTCRSCCCSRASLVGAFPLRPCPRPRLQGIFVALHCLKNGRHAHKAENWKKKSWTHLFVVSCEIY